MPRRAVDVVAIRHCAEYAAAGASSLLPRSLLPGHYEVMTLISIARRTSNTAGGQALYLDGFAIFAPIRPADERAFYHLLGQNRRFGRAVMRRRRRRRWDGTASRSRRMSAAPRRKSSRQRRRKCTARCAVPRRQRFYRGFAPGHASTPPGDGMICPPAPAAAARWVKHAGKNDAKIVMKRDFNMNSQ